MYDDRQLIIGSSTEGQAVQIYDFASQTVVARPAGWNAVVWQLELNRTNDVLTYGCVNGEISLYDVKRQQSVHTIKYYSKAVRALKWQARSEHQFLVSTEGSVLHQWDTRRLDEPVRKVNVPTNSSDGIFLRLSQNSQGQ